MEKPGPLTRIRYDIKPVVPCWANCGRKSTLTRHILISTNEYGIGMTLCGHTSIRIFNWNKGPPYCLRCLAASLRISEQWDVERLEP